MANDAVLARAAAVDVWCLSLDASDREVGRLAGLLSEDEHAALRRIPSPERRRRLRTAWGTRRLILAARLGRSPNGVVLDRGTTGAPELAPPTGGLRFSLSHAGAAMAFAVSSGARVGVDIERSDPRGDIRRLARRFFLPLEADEIEALSPDEARERFVRIWVRKEAVIKALGGGVPSRLRSVSAGANRETVCAGGARWTLRDVAAPSGYACAVAVEGEATVVLHQTLEVRSAGA